MDAHAYPKRMLSEAESLAGTEQGKLKSDVVMAQNEAIKILGLNKDRVSKKQILAQYEKLFKLNERGAGGSPYLQFKISKARDTLLESGFPDDLPDESPKAAEKKEAAEAKDGAAGDQKKATEEKK